MQDMEQIYKQYFKTVKKYVYCLTRNNDIAEELTQETFYKAVQKIHTFKGNCKISVWLCQIAKNLWYNELKKNKRLQSIQDLEIISEEEIETKVIANESKIDMYRRMHNLDENTREVMYLRTTGELSFKEIASILGKTENWTRVTFYRGKQKLKESEKNEL